jgi:hypothetical protein
MPRPTPSIFPRMIFCPECGSANVQVLGKRNALYPVAFLVFFPTVFAMLHQASSPIDYRCPQCGLCFARRTSSARFALLVPLVVLVGGLLLVAFIFSLVGVHHDASR